MIHALKIAMVHAKKYFYSQNTRIASSKTKIAMIYKLKLSHGNFSLSTMATRV